MGRHKGQSTMESYMLMNGKSGDCFYSDKQDKTITALANYYNRKIITERLITITTAKKEPSAKYITKITIL